jgi:hypothetical protein
MPAWFLQLAGDSSDLNRLADAFRDGDLVVAAADGQWRMRYAPYDQIIEPISAEAEYGRLLGHVNALALVEWGDDYDPVTSGGFGEAKLDGSTHWYLSSTVTARARVSGTLLVTGPDGEPVPPPPSPLPGMMSVAIADADVDDALHFLQRNDPTWGELYKVLEIVEGRAGRIDGNGWASDNERSRFRRSANHQDVAGRDARHARLNTEPPPNPMSLPEARTFIRGVVRQWLASRPES